MDILQVFLSVSFVLGYSHHRNVFLVLQIEITGNFSLRRFEHCKWKEFPKQEMHSSDSSERTGTDFSAVKHQSHQPSSSI